MNSKRKPIPKEQEKLFEEINSLEREGKELAIKIDRTLKQIEDYRTKNAEREKNE